MRTLIIKEGVIWMTVVRIKGSSKEEYKKNAEEFVTTVADMFINSEQDPAAYEEFKKRVKDYYFGGVNLGQR